MQVEWLRPLVARVGYRFVFESALELMGATRVGSFVMDPSGEPPVPARPSPGCGGGMLAYVHAARLCRSATMPAALRCCWCCVGKSKGPPPAVKKVLSMFGSGREEDKMVGYLSFLKVGEGGGGCGAAMALWRQT